jgi:hypothetical protein
MKLEDEVRDLAQHPIGTLLLHPSNQLSSMAKEWEEGF